MKFWPLVLFSIVTLVLSCSDSSSRAGTERGNIKNKQVPKKKPASNYSDTVTLKVPSALFYNADSLQWERIKAITDTMIFESTVHDCVYQMKNARNSLQKNWPEVKIVEVSNARWVRFRLSNGTSEYIDLDELDDPCGILLFDGHKRARPVDMMNIDSDLGFYFAE